MTINSQQSYSNSEINLKLTLKNKAKKIRDITFLVHQNSQTQENKEKAIKKQSFSQMFNKITRRIKANLKQEYRKSFYQATQQNSSMIVQTVQINKKSGQKLVKSRKPAFSRLYSQRNQEYSVETEKNYSHKERIFKGSLFSRPHKFVYKRVSMQKNSLEGQNNDKQISQNMNMNKQFLSNQDHYQVNNANSSKQQKMPKHHKISNIKHIKSSHTTFKLKYFDKRSHKDSTSEKNIKTITINSILIPNTIKDFKLSPWCEQQPDFNKFI